MRKENSHKHICIVSPSLKIGGIERALTVLANYFAKTGLHVTFISCLSGHRFYDLHPTIKVIEPTMRRTVGKFNALLFYPRLAMFIRKQVKKAKPDVVLAFGDWFSPLVLLAMYKTKYPVFISDRTSPDYHFKFPVPLLKKLFYPGSAGFIAQTQRAADYKRLQFGNKLNICVIPNAIREVKLYPEINRDKVVLFVGRFAWEKGPERIIRAFAGVQDHKGWRLQMAGTGPLLEPMKKLVYELNIENEVDFLGQVEDVDILFAKSSIYVLPSVLEGFPNSLCEAMSAGLPCICFDSIPHEEILVSGESGIVVREDSIQELSIQLYELMQNKKERERIGKNATGISDRLNVNIIGDQVLDFITLK